MPNLAPNSPKRGVIVSPRLGARWVRWMASASVVIGLGSAAPVGAALAEERCGWLENPTPGNWWLKDARGVWNISAQGGPYAEGVEKLPEAAPDRFVATNGHYGYSCACVTGVFDDQLERISRVDSGRVLPLSVCRNDKALPAPFGG
jgi:hypothetical protein